MQTVTFRAGLPRNSREANELRRIFALFSAIEADVLASPARAIKSETNFRLGDTPELQSEWDYDMVHDIVAAHSVSQVPILSGYVGLGFWSFGRTGPFFGTPWAGITFDRTRGETILRIRIGGSFAEDDDPPQWAECSITEIDGSSSDSLQQALFDSSSFDVWVRPSGNNLVGAVVIHEKGDAVKRY